MSFGVETVDHGLLSVTGSDDFDARHIEIVVEGTAVRVKDILESGAPGREALISRVRKIIAQLNDGFEFDRELAEEWTKYLILVHKGYGRNLIDPYSGIVNYQIEPLLEDLKDLNGIASIKILEELPAEALQKTDLHDRQFVSKTLLIIAIGGTDSTFYQGLSKEEINRFAEEMYAADLLASFKKYEVVDLMPRGFATKQDASGNSVTNIESTILQAYHAGIRHVAIFGNARTYKPIAEYLGKKFGSLQDLKIVVTAQPLLPIIRAHHDTKKLVVAAENGCYPGGHGHGFKYCLRDKNVQRLIRENDLEFFIFGNGDNTVTLNWGANHFVSSIKAMKALCQHEAYKKLRIAFFFVWEYLRKGGFAFILTNQQTGNRIVQIFEAELAEKSGAEIKSLATHRGGYNTNVATGILANALEHLEFLPMALKRKNEKNYTNFLFEASLGTAMTTRQNADGTSRFEENAAIGVLGPQTAKFQHWNHISIRKRDDFFAYFSSLFKIKKLATSFGEFPVIFTTRDARQGYPLLKGNFVDILNTKDFFAIFKNADVDVDEFTGALKIDLMEEAGKPRGRIKFEGNIKLAGNGEVSIAVPAGESWIIRDKIFDARKGCSVGKDDVILI